jgi:carboxymethylenebutenolidase
VVAQDVTITGTDGRFSAYLAEPAAARAPGLVLGQYICGVNRVMRAIADDFASRGFLTMVPDLFWRQEPNVQLLNDPTKPDPEEQKRALALNAGFNNDAGIVDLIATLASARAHPRCSGKVGVLGCCLGGRMAYLAATRTDADCSVGYYGVNIEAFLAEAAQIKKPMMLHVAGRDQLSSDDARRQILQTMQPNPLVTIHVYDEAGHAFAHLPGPSHRSADAALADQRSLAFLGTHLGSAA